MNYQRNISFQPHWGKVVCSILALCGLVPAVIWVLALVMQIALLGVQVIGSTTHEFMRLYDALPAAVQLALLLLLTAGAIWSAVKLYLFCTGVLFSIRETMLDRQYMREQHARQRRYSYGA